MPSLKEIYLNLSCNALDNIFLHELESCLNKLTYLLSANIKLNQNQFSYKQSKKFIIYIQKRFQIKDNIECSYNNKQIYLACGKSSVSFNPDFNKSIFIKEGQTKQLKIIISKGQDEFKAYIKQCLKQEIENLQVIIYFNNQKIAVCQSNINCQLLISLHFEEKIDLQNYIYSHHDIVHIGLNQNNNFLNQAYFKSYSHVNLELRNGEVDVLLFQNSKHTENIKKFIQKQIPQERIEQISNIYFNNNSEIQFANQYILPRMLLVQGNLIQNTISFYFQYKRDKKVIFAKFDTLKEIDEKNKKFYFFDIDIMIMAFNNIFSILQNSQLTLYGLNLYANYAQIAQQNKQFFLKMVNKSVEYNIQKLYIELKDDRGDNYFDLIIPIIEEIKSLKEMYFRNIFEKFLNNNIKYLQKNKSKSMYHLIMDYNYYDIPEIQNTKKQYSINNVNVLSSNGLQLFNFSKCKRLVFFNRKIPEKYNNDNFKDDGCCGNCNCYFYDWYCYYCYISKCKKLVQCLCINCGEFIYYEEVCCENTECQSYHNYHNYKEEEIKNYKDLCYFYK